MPRAIDISKQPTQNVSCSGGVCTPAAKNAVLNVGDLTNMLASGDLTVQSGNGDDTSAGITIVNGFSWTNSSRLTLTAKNNLAVKAPVTVAGNGSLTIAYAAGNPNGDLQFEKKGKIDFWDTNSSLIINGEIYVLEPDIKTLAADIAANASGSFALIQDYDASGDGTYKDAPVGTTLKGRFEGLAHTIVNLSAESRRAVALFYELDSGASVRDINLQSVTVVGKARRAFAAGLAVMNEGAIKNVSVSGSVYSCLSQYCPAGGVVVSNATTGSIQNAKVSATVGGGEATAAGGIAAENDGSIVGSVATGTVTTVGSTLCCAPSAGGLVGYNSGNILLSHADAHVSGGSYKQQYSDPVLPSSGGLVGENAGIIDRSYASGSVADGTAGGLVGFSIAGKIENSYSLGEAGGYDGGGLAGTTWGPTTILSVYSIGSATAYAYDGCSAGGFIGCEGGDIAGGYWDIDTSGLSKGCGIGDCVGVTGLTDEQLRSGVPAGFDPKVWGQSPAINNGYPYLLANPPPK